MLVAYRYDDKEENYPLSCEWIRNWLFSMPHYNVFLPYVKHTTCCISLYFAEYFGCKYSDFIRVCVIRRMFFIVSTLVLVFSALAAEVVAALCSYCLAVFVPTFELVPVVAVPDMQIR